MRRARKCWAEIGGWEPPLLRTPKPLRDYTAKRATLAVWRRTQVLDMRIRGMTFREIGEVLGISHTAARKAWLWEDSSAMECAARLGLELVLEDPHNYVTLPRRDRRRRGKVFPNGVVGIPRCHTPGWPSMTYHPAAYSDRMVLRHAVHRWQEGAAFFGWLDAMPYPHWGHLTDEQAFLVTYYLRRKYSGPCCRAVKGYVWAPPPFGPLTREDFAKSKHIEQTGAALNMILR